MNKKQAAFIILLSVAFSLVINIFLGRLISAEVSTLPLLNRWKLLSPQAPIVINTREEVRVSDTTDLLKVSSLARPKLGAIVSVDGSEVVLAGTAANLASDGLFLTSKTALASAKQENLYIKLDDGSMAPVVAVYVDPATNLAIVKAGLNNVPVANIISSVQLSAGERVVLLAPGLKSYSTAFQASFVNASQAGDYAAIFDSDKPSQAFGLQSTGALLPGQAIVNLNGDIAGIWDGSGIVSGDVIRDFVNGFFSSGNKVLRPSFGFRFRNVSAVGAKLTNAPVGAKVAKVEPGSAAQKAGLAEGDTITAVNDTQLSADNVLSMYLSKIKPGDSIKLSVTRGKNQIILNLTAGELN